MESHAGVRTKALLATVLLLALTSAACGGGGGSDCTSQNATTLTDTLAVKGGFSPNCFSVASGSTISIANDDIRFHNFTVEDTDVAVPLPVGETGEATAPAPGTYDFECTIHPAMRGTMIVT